MRYWLMPIGLIRRAVKIQLDGIGGINLAIIRAILRAGADISPIKLTGSA